MTADDDDAASADLEQRVVETLIDLREERGWSQSELARRMVEAGWPKYTQMTVSRTEKGERPIRLNEMETLAQVFDVELYTLWNPRGVRLLSAAMQRTDQLSRDLEKAIATYLDAQRELAHRADSLHLADEEVATVSIMAAELLETPEQLARLARARTAGRTTNDDFDSFLHRSPKERAAEERFWGAPQSERSFVKLFEDINGEHSEEA